MKLKGRDRSPFSHMKWTISGTTAGARGRVNHPVMLFTPWGSRRARRVAAVFLIRPDPPAIERTQLADRLWLIQGQLGHRRRRRLFGHFRFPLYGDNGKRHFLPWRRHCNGLWSHHRLDLGFLNPCRAPLCQSHPLSPVDKAHDLIARQVEVGGYLIRCRPLLP